MPKRVKEDFFEIQNTNQKQISAGFKPDLIKFRITSTNENFNTDTKFNGEEFGWGHGVAKTKSTIKNLGITEGHGSQSTNGMAAATSSTYSLFQVITPDDGNGINGWVEGEVVSTNSTGFTISFNRVDKAPLYAQYTAYKLSDGESVDVGTTSFPTSSTTNQITNGFSPNYVHVFAQTNPNITGMDQQFQQSSTQSGWTLGWAQKESGIKSEIVVSNNMFVNNIDDHNWAASDQNIVYIPEAASKSGVTGRTKASINFLSNGFELDFSKSGSGQPAIYIALSLNKVPEIGYDFTPTSTGFQTVNVGKDFNALRVIGSNTITGINTDSHIGREQHGFMFGSLTEGKQHSMGFSSNSNSVNGHSSGSRNAKAYHMLYTDQDGNIESRETAKISFLNNSYELNWQNIASNSSTSIDSALFVYIAYPTEFEGNTSLDTKNVDLQKKVVGHWTMNFEDTDNGKLRDRSAYDNHGTLNGGIKTGKNSPIGEAYEFDGTDDYIEIGNASDSKLVGATEATIAGWINTNQNSGKHRIYDLRNPSGFDSALLQLLDGQASIVFTDSGGNELFLDKGPKPNTNEWIHYAVVWFGGNQVKFYVNGQDSTNQFNVNKSNGPSEISSSAGKETIGNRKSSSEGESDFWDGKIGDLRIYRRALSFAEVDQLYKQRSRRYAKFSNNLFNVEATGGNVTTNSKYKIHEFTSDGTFTVNSKGTVDVLLVGGGGGGGDEFTGYTTAGGGGGGGILFLENYSVSPGSYSITVGSGGQGGQSTDDNGYKGGNTTAFGKTAYGGGGGASGSLGISAPTYPNYGGGGGAAGNNPGDASGAPATPQGNEGGDSGGEPGGEGGKKAGGGGGGTGGSSGGKGGNGAYFGDIFSDSFGENGYFAGGGGAGPNADGGKGGGGKASNSGETDGTGGGGGAGEDNEKGFSGGDGVVLIRYKK